MGKGNKGKGAKKGKGQTSQANPEREAFKTLTDAAEKHSVLLTNYLKLKREIEEKERRKQEYITRIELKKKEVYAANASLNKFQVDNAVTASGNVKLDLEMSKEEMNLVSLEEQLQEIEEELRRQ